MPTLRWTLLLVVVGVCAPAAAQFDPPAPRRADVPEALEPWIPWVLHGQQKAFCPSVAEQALCAWPSRLRLDLKESGGRFTMEVFAEHARYVPLPGSAQRFPEHVNLDGRPEVVLDGPRVWVAGGAHRIEGEFRWPALPKSLATPFHTGLVELRLQGRLVPQARRDAQGNLWLHGQQDGASGEERLELEVYRRIDDGIPLQVLTRIELTAGGQARELILPDALLPRTAAIDLRSTLPARLQGDGRLRIRLSAGQHTIDILAISPGPLQELRSLHRKSPWPEREVWVWAADPVLRQVELSGAAQIDPARANLPEAFRGLPAYLLTAGGSLRLQTRRRGDAAPRDNQLRLERELWLELDGNAYTVRDTLTGSMHQNFRLDLTEGQLGRVAIDGTDQLITKSGARSGVEIRSGTLNALAEWRIARRDRVMPAVAWSEDVEHLRTTLHLPPGWSLLDASGADRADETLLSRWDLWSFFFVLLLTLGTAQLCGWRWGLIALVALILCSHEPGAPEFSWLFLLGALALLQLPLAGPARALMRVALLLSLLSILLISAPFAANQIKLALFPQASPGGGPFVEQGLELSMPAASPEPAAALMEDAEAAQAGLSSSREYLRKPLLAESPAPPSPAKKGRVLPHTLQDDPGEVVQTGPGVPSWTHNRYTLAWSGPVQQDQKLTLRLLPPWLNRMLCLLRVLLLGLLLFGLLRKCRPAWANALPGSATALLLLSVTAPGAPAAAQAGIAPRAEILNELKTRLTAPPPCSPDCLSVASLAVRLSADHLTLTAAVDAGATVAYQAPGPLSSWAPQTVALRGAAEPPLARLKEDFLYVRLAAGSHLVELAGPAPAADTLTLQLGTAPRRVQVSAPGWEVAGVRPDGSAAGAIQLRRKVVHPAQGATADLRPWLRVRRRFQFGTNFRVHTQFHRVGDTDDALLVRFPLLPGESVTQSDIGDDGQAALIALAKGQTDTQFVSALPVRSELTLQAPDDAADRPWSETWEIDCSALYHCIEEGLVPISRLEGEQVLSTYRPYPGEALTLHLARLAGAQGASSTVDDAAITFAPGDRLTMAELTLTVRSSGGTTPRITLPKGVRLKAVTVDGQTRAAHVHDRALELSLSPGHHALAVAWQQPLGIGPRFKAPYVELDRALSNVRVRIRVPDNRWLLWVTGPSWGPAVLFWGYLLAALLFALALARVPNNPLRQTQWVLLSLGLTQVETGAALLVVGWFFAMWTRQRRPPTQRWLFNTVQVLLVLLSLLAAGVLVEAVHQGLLVQPDMQVQGAGSDGPMLRWYVDRTAGALPTPSLFSLPLWIYKGLMLLWALWLAASALSWLRFFWNAWSSGGRWRGRTPAVSGPGQAAPEPTPTARSGESEVGRSGEPG